MCVFLLYFRWNFDREVDVGPMLAVLGCSWGLCWRSWAALGAYVGGPGRTGGGRRTYVGDLELLLGLYGRSWAALGASIGGLGCTWAALGAYVGGLGLPLGPQLTVLGRSWSLCWRSWAGLGA